MIFLILALTQPGMGNGYRILLTPDVCSRKVLMLYCTEFYCKNYSGQSCLMEKYGCWLEHKSFSPLDWHLDPSLFSHHIYHQTTIVTRMPFMCHSLTVVHHYLHPWSSSQFWASINYYFVFQLLSKEKAIHLTSLTLNLWKSYEMGDLNKIRITIYILYLS